MTITANIQPFITEENPKDDPLYRKLEIYMQRLGHLVPYREQLNWTEPIDSVDLGDEKDLNELKKLAAKNDNSLLFYARLTKKTIYQHIICHPNETGIYLPFHFETPFTVTNNNHKLWFGSAPRLLEELKWMEISLKSKGDEDILSFWEQFQKAAHLANTHMSPMILQKN